MQSKCLIDNATTAIQIYFIRVNFERIYKSTYIVGVICTYSSRINY